MSDWIGCLNNRWVRASCVMGVIVDNDLVKLRAPGVFAFDPTYMQCEDVTVAQRVAASLVADLAGAP